MQAYFDGPNRASVCSMKSNLACDRTAVAAHADQLSRYEVVAQGTRCEALRRWSFTRPRTLAPIIVELPEGVGLHRPVCRKRPRTRDLQL